MKATTVKAKFEKILNVGFIYPISMMEWVSNPVPIDKNQGIIHICTYFRDFNK